MIKSDIQIIKILYTKKKKPHPYIVTFHSGIRSDFLNMVLANSITLTPGTITVDQNKDHFTVHCFEKSFADGIDKSDFTVILKKMEEIR